MPAVPAVGQTTSSVSISRGHVLLPTPPAIGDLLRSVGLHTLNLETSVFTDLMVPVTLMVCRLWDYRMLDTSDWKHNIELYKEAERKSIHSVSFYG
jgi:hypothetical protein